MLDAIPEAQDKKPRSNALVVSIAVIAFLAGTQLSTLLIGMSHLGAEIDGLRSDFEHFKNEQYYPQMEEVNEDADQLREKVYDTN